MVIPWRIIVMLYPKSRREDRGIITVLHLLHGVVVVEEGAMNMVVVTLSTMMILTRCTNVNPTLLLPRIIITTLQETEETERVHHNNMKIIETI